MVGEHDDGLARLLGLLDGGLEPGHLLRVPAVRVRGLQFPLQGSSRSCTPHIRHIPRVCVCACVRVRVRVRVRRVVSLRVGEKGESTCGAGHPDHGVVVHGALDLIEILLWAVVPQSGPQNPHLVPCVLFSPNSFTRHARHDTHVTHDTTHDTTQHVLCGRRTVVFEQDGAHLQEVQVVKGAAKLCNFPMHRISARVCVCGGVCGECVLCGW